MNRPRQFDLIVFDWDGTLFDSTAHIAQSIQAACADIGAPVPSEFMLMVPYVVTIFVVAGVVGKSRAPAASGKPYIKG